MYKSKFTPNLNALSILKDGQILADGESPSQMIERVINEIFTYDLRHGNNLIESTQFAKDLGNAMDENFIIMSTTVLTNAGRHIDRPLSACAVPTSAIRKGNEKLIGAEIKLLHEQGMGTGFNLDETDDPVGMLRFLNKIAVEGASNGRESRPVGNMAVLSIYHPKILDFINAKQNKKEKWKFNLSVNVDKNFMLSLENNDTITLKDGTKLSSKIVFDNICNMATYCGDPGLVFLDRMNDRNPVPGLGEYKTTAPCAEVGLLDGETCQFGYINLAKFIISISPNTFQVDQENLKKVSRMMTRALDDILDISRENLLSDRSRYLLDQKRKIGIGICGVADALLIAGLPYDSDEGIQLIQDMLALINFNSKLESVELAEQRGNCMAMNSKNQNRYFNKESYLERLYSNITTSFVSKDDWKSLGNHIRTTRKLRNISTIALPPTGRSALIIDASTGIEPYFTLDSINDVAKKNAKILGLIYEGTKYLKRILGTACDITPIRHIAMASSLQMFSDESLSKTINMPKGSTKDEVAETYIFAHQSGMSGVTIYINGTHKKQPMSLTGNKSQQNELSSWYNSNKYTKTGAILSNAR